MISDLTVRHVASEVVGRRSSRKDDRGLSDGVRRIDLENVVMRGRSEQIHRDESVMPEVSPVCLCPGCSPCCSCNGLLLVFVEFNRSDQHHRLSSIRSLSLVAAREETIKTTRCTLHHAVERFPSAPSLGVGANRFICERRPKGGPDASCTSFSKRSE